MPPIPLHGNLKEQKDNKIKAEIIHGCLLFHTKYVIFNYNKNKLNVPLS